APSNAMPLGRSPRLVATVETAPAGWVGSIMYRLPAVLMNAGAKTLPMATSGCSTLVAPVQVSRILPSLPRTRVTDPSLKLVAHRSLPSDLTHWAPLGRLVNARTVSFWDVQNRLSTALGPPRFRALSTVIERNFAIWRRVTLPPGS